MSLTEFLTEVFCLVDDTLIDLKAQLREDGEPLRSRGPSPTVPDSVVLTCELAGEPVGQDTDSGLFSYFQRHRGVVPQVSITDSFPMPVCRLMGSSYCRLFEGEAAFGHNETNDQTKQKLQRARGDRLAWGRGEHRHRSDGRPRPYRRSRSSGGGPKRGNPRDASRTVLGDTAYHSQRLDAELSDSVQLEAPSRSENETWPRSLIQIRRRVETVISQLCERFNAKRVWARDPWHLTVRWIRKLHGHTMGMLLCYRHGHPPLQFAKLID